MTVFSSTPVTHRPRSRPHTIQDEWPSKPSGKGISPGGLALFPYFATSGCIRETPAEREPFYPHTAGNPWAGRFLRPAQGYSGVGREGEDGAETEAAASIRPPSPTRAYENKTIRGKPAMANYCNGTATLSGAKDTLDRIETLISRLDDCAAISGFDGDADWLPHIFKEEYCGEGIFCEGCWRNGDKLDIYIRAKSTDGEDFFRQMATGLAVAIEWDYVSDYDDEKYHATCLPGQGPAWELRSEAEIDGDEEETADAKLRKIYETLDGVLDCVPLGSCGNAERKIWEHVVKLKDMLDDLFG